MDTLSIIFIVVLCIFGCCVIVDCVFLGGNRGPSPGAKDPYALPKTSGWQGTLGKRQEISSPLPGQLRV